MQKFGLVYTPFPPEAGRALTGATQQRKGYCLILIDSTAPAETQAATLRHELAHIALNHFADTTRDLQEIEAEANSYAARMTKSEFDALMAWEMKGGSRQCG